MKNKKEDVIFVSVLLALLIVFVLFKVLKSKDVEELVVDAPAVESSTTEDQAQKPAVVKKAKKTTIWPERSYSEEFNKYRDGRLVQFGTNCEASPATMAIPNGSSVMLDNRSSVKQVISIRNDKYTLAPYDFEIFTIKEAQTPNTYLLSCNDRPNVATLLVE
jgi:hypothetical protein